MTDRLDDLKLPPSTPADPSPRFSRELYERLREELTPLLLTIGTTSERQDAMTASTRATVSPALRVSLGSRDAHTHIKWLTDVLGFRLTALFEEPDGGVAASQLAWKDGAVHLSTRVDGGRMPPTGPCSIGLTCDDRDEVDGLYERAVAAGAEVIVPIEETFYGGYHFSLRDPEGNIWGAGIEWLESEAAKSLPQRRI